MRLKVIFTKTRNNRCKCGRIVKLRHLSHFIDKKEVYAKLKKEKCHEDRIKIMEKNLVHFIANQCQCGRLYICELGKKAYFDYFDYIKK